MSAIGPVSRFYSTSHLVASWRPWLQIQPSTTFQTPWDQPSWNMANPSHHSPKGGSPSLVPHFWPSFVDLKLGPHHRLSLPGFCSFFHLASLNNRHMLELGMRCMHILCGRLPAGLVKLSGGRFLRVRRFVNGFGGEYLLVDPSTSESFQQGETVSILSVRIITTPKQTGQALETQLFVIGDGTEGCEVPPKVKKQEVSLRVEKRKAPPKVRPNGLDVPGGLLGRTWAPAQRWGPEPGFGLESSGLVAFRDKSQVVFQALAHLKNAIVTQRIQILVCPTFLRANSHPAQIVRG
ncbi:hypothetical protein B0H10DRAFT_1940845 [Mycena sp. CBHHK59/15]|nr:hypothetical protein B0H10DRAFT_1940845 [Mycena sp. CBHHK59/15]